MAKDAHPAQAGLDHREKVKNEQVADYYARSEAAKPTPTPEEIDRAKLGMPVDEKEPDGSPPEHETVRRVMESRIPGANPYDVRDMSAPRPAPAPAPKPAAPAAPKKD